MGWQRPSFNLKKQWAEQTSDLPTLYWEFFSTTGVEDRKISLNNLIQVWVSPFHALKAKSTIKVIMYLINREHWKANKVTYTVYDQQLNYCMYAK